MPWVCRGPHDLPRAEPGVDGGEIDDETLIQQVQATFEQLINAWLSARR